MLRTFLKYGGGVQAILGLLGQFVPGVSSALGTQSGGDVFNIISGAVLSYMGFKGSQGTQQTGAQVLGGLNGIVGLLGVFGLKSLFGIPLSEGLISNIINLGIGAWGLMAGFKKKA